MNAQPKRRRLELEVIGDVTVVNFTDKRILDDENIRIIGEQLFSLVEDQGHRKILLNFTNVEYLSSAANGKFITLNNMLGRPDMKGKLVMCGIIPTVYEVFEITRLNKLFNIQKDEQTGLKAF